MSPCHPFTVSSQLATAAQLLAEPGDGAAQPLLNLDLWLPAQNTLGFGDIRLTHLRIIERAHILVHQPSRVLGQVVDHFGKLLDRVTLIAPPVSPLRNGRPEGRPLVPPKRIRSLSLHQHQPSDRLGHLIPASQ